jgi:cell division protein FtsZ
MKGRPVVFILAGMGGMTGSYVSPLVSYMVRKSSKFVVAITCSPFSVEGQGRRQHCFEGLKRLRQQADMTIVFDNDILAKEVPNLPLRRAFSLMDEFMNALPNDAVLVHTAKWVEEAKAIASSSRECAAALGLGAGSEAAERAVRDALRSPWLQGGAGSYKKGLMVISGPPGTEKIALDTAALEAPELKLTALRRSGDYGESRASILMGK